MSNFLRSTVSAAALVGVAATVSPVLAQQALLADVEIEGPIQGFSAPAAGEQAPDGRPIIGVITVMGVTVKVPEGAPIHTPTNDSLTWEEFTTGPLPGRTEPAGFKGGTAIVTGDSLGGVIYATDVFSDLAENVVVGAATATVTDDVNDTVQRATVNNMVIVPSTDPRMPAGRPINSFGFEIHADRIDPGSLISVEGYFAGGKLYYHTLEADGGLLKNPSTPEISILRAQCRIRGGGRDELEVRGGTKNPANGRVTIQRLQSDGVTWVNVAATVNASSATPIVDNLVSPPQGLYRYTSSSLRFPGGVCPAQVRAVFTANPTVASEGFTPDSR